jgi:hypothetical protein
MCIHGFVMQLPDNSKCIFTQDNLRCDMNRTKKMLSTIDTTNNITLLHSRDYISKLYHVITRMHKQYDSIYSIESLEKIYPNLTNYLLDKNDKQLDINLTTLESGLCIVNDFIKRLNIKYNVEYASNIVFVEFKNIFQVDDLYKKLLLVEQYINYFNTNSIYIPMRWLGNDCLNKSLESLESEIHNAIHFDEVSKINELTKGYITYKKNFDHDFWSDQDSNKTSEIIHEEVEEFKFLDGICIEN